MSLIMGKTPHLNMKKIELLVCIYEFSRDQVFKYGISGCSRCLTLVTIVNPIPSQVHLGQLYPSQLNHVCAWCVYFAVQSIWVCTCTCNWEQSTNLKHLQKRPLKFPVQPPLQVVDLNFWTLQKTDGVTHGRNQSFDRLFRYLDLRPV